ncbi:LEAF RUST 10 DISEASE-RESISTANCE LOCUS RECEPTOR-LIKE PROTEIN KINASE-like 2.5 [Vigna radiata var. radiata]|uniref:LEAF RUST 10 DISEASE-RESISTANCE LOCUS RECEPTOR-LIKE PROTEIN KINASE-like 2.5 n=1 Tax=Vigna radiata var. radiata TaxID=3916 RepID=A0A3Q0F9Q2_VIGRR|nr:LEAF RUST 10 DISEASE-RESISTANCE LOCUS RECEPTOR-LIKE PROTEIN KINASE-like 2.5 [Vigna radiata var. radiata]
MRERVVREVRRSVRMDDKHTHIHTSPLAFALTVSCFFCIALPHSHSQPSPPPSSPPPPCAEPSYMCRINVSGNLDPVWKQIPPSQCISSDSSPQLSCSASYESQNFTVKKFNNSIHTMTVVPAHTVNDVCSPDFFHIYDNLKNSLLKHYESTRNVIVFFDGCPLDIPNFPSERKFKCGDAVYYFRGRDETYVHTSLEYCKKSLLVPIAAPLGDYDNKDGGAEVLKEALRDGFQISYSPPQRCRRCTEINGNCWSGGYGYNGDVVSCNYYCPNQYCSPKSKSNGNWDQKRKFIILGVTGSAIAAVLILFSILCVRYTSPTWQANFGLASKSNQNIEAFLRIHGPLALKRYKLSDVKKMTNNFRVKLGQGGFGAVYKGKLSNGSVVAVKMLSTSKKNGEEFVNEVASISRTSHVNVVSLLGFCLKGHKRALIYEFMSNGSLDKFIYRTRDETLSALSWDIMYQIARDIARGLEYLHKGCNTRIFHFDIKPHNILLDDNFCAKISDFGLAKLCPRNESIVSLSDARGTMGYVAPEMWSRNLGRVSHKSDVYSYGMMLLEMVGGRKNINAEASHTSEIYFPHWAYNKLELENDLRPDMEMTAEENEIVKRLAMVGLWCTQTFPNDRPTMSEVIDMLEGNMDSIQIPPKPLLSSPTRSVPEYSIS